MMPCTYQACQNIYQLNCVSISRGLGYIRPMNKSASTDNLGIAFCLSATLIFSCQDAITKMLVSSLPAPQFIMIRFWAFLIFALVFAGFNGGIKISLKTKRPFLQILRGLLLILQIILFAYGLKHLSLADMHSLFVLFPVFVTVLAIPVLGETIGWRRIVAVTISFLGALIILRPGMGVFGWEALYPIGCAAMFAVYNLLTRLTSYDDHYSSNILYVAIIGALVSTAWGSSLWQTPDKLQWIYILSLCVTGVAGHVLLMKALEYSEASKIQPFNYFTLVWAIIISIVFFSEIPDLWTLVGAGIIISSGLYVLRRSQLN